MAALIKSPFRGLNADLYATRTPSGTAGSAVNVTVRGGDLQKRAGFALFSGAAPGASAVKNIFVVPFADGDIYIVVKAASGELWQRKIYPTDAGGGMAITTSHTHDATDRGWGYCWGDRFHYADRGGVSRWNPDVNGGTAYKDGLPVPTIGPLIATAGGGEKDGRYHVTLCYRNSVTREESPISGFQYSTNPPTPLECHIATNTGGIAISNKTTIDSATNDIAWEWDQLAFYTTMGNTEYIDRGSGAECYSYRAYLDAIVAATHAGTGSAGLNKADHVLNPRDQFTNAGGEPPPSAIGCYIGSRAIYGRIYSGSTLIGDKICFSIPNFPAMVPKAVTYSIGGDSKTFYPWPWVGEVIGGISGEAVAMASGGGIISAFTSTSTFLLSEGSDGKLYPRILSASSGCAADGAAIGLPWGVAVIGFGTCTIIRSDGYKDISQYRFSSLLAETPAAHVNKTVLGYYSFRDQLWIACAGSGQTKANRILVLEDARQALQGGGNLSVFEPAFANVRDSLTIDPTGSNNGLVFTSKSLGSSSVTVATVSGAALAVSVAAKAITITYVAGTTIMNDIISALAADADANALVTVNNRTTAPVSDGTGTWAASDAIAATPLFGAVSTEGITALCEMSLPNATPVMLVGTDAGKIYKYPSGTDDAGTNFFAQWRGIFGQERSDSAQQVKHLECQVGTNAANNVIMGVRPMRNASETGAQYVKVLQKSNGIESDLTIFGKTDGRMYQVEFVSDQQNTTQWTIRDLALRISDTSDERFG